MLLIFSVWYRGSLKILFTFFFFFLPFFLQLSLSFCFQTVLYLTGNQIGATEVVDKSCYLVSSRWVRSAWLSWRSLWSPKLCFQEVSQVIPQSFFLTSKPWMRSRVANVCDSVELDTGRSMLVYPSPLLGCYRSSGLKIAFVGVSSEFVQTAVPCVPWKKENC